MMTKTAVSHAGEGSSIATLSPREPAPSPSKILILNQAFYPDVASTAQHAADLAEALADRGHRVSAIASSRCYDNPEKRYTSRERWRNVDIHRVWSSGFGKKARWRRAADFLSFLVLCTWRLLLFPKQDVVIALTSPPLISFLAALFVKVRGGKLVFWTMDLNPDEAIAAGWLKPDSLPARTFGWMLRYSIKASERLIALDRFMADLLVLKGASRQRIDVLPPWSHNSAVSFDPEGRAEFRAAHGMQSKFVVMYSGNHSPCHPVTTLLHAARELSGRTDIMFAFIGGGSEWKTVQRFAETERLGNIICLPYQPLDVLSSSLSAADLHSVIMGDPFVGIVHPCKIYNILTLGTPVLYVGPARSHIGDLAQRDFSWLYGARHGDVKTVVESILDAASRKALSIGEEMQTGARFAQETLVAEHVACVENCVPISSRLRARAS